MRPFAKRIRKAVVTVAGFVILAAGLAMVVLPGPALVVIPLGLGLLASEFPWARNWLNRFKSAAKKAVGKRATHIDKP